MINKERQRTKKDRKMKNEMRKESQMSSPSEHFFLLVIFTAPYKEASERKDERQNRENV